MPTDDNASTTGGEINRHSRGPVRRSPWTRLALILGLLAVTGTARADDDRKGPKASGAAIRASVQRRAQLHHDAGRENYLAGRYELAITEFEAAYSLVPEPILLFNLAQAHRKKGSRDQAILFYQRYLAAAPRARDREEVETRIRELQAESATQTRESLQPLSVASTSPPAGVRYQPPPPPTTPDPPAVQPPMASQLTATPDPPDRLDSHRFRAQLTLGGAHPMLLGSTILTEQLLAVGLSGAYVVALGSDRQLDVGVSCAWSPLSYKKGTGEDVWSSLLGLYGSLALRLPVGTRLTLGPTVGVGVVWWSGLGEGNPFSGGRKADGAIAMPSVRASVAGLLALGRHLFVALDLGGSFTKTVGEELEREVSSIVRIEGTLSLGLGL